MEDVAVCPHCAAEEERRNRVGFRIKYTVAIFSGIMLVIGLLLEYVQFGYFWIYAVFLASMLTAGRWVIPEGFRGAISLHLDMNFLMTFAAFGAVLIGAPAEGAAALFLFNIAELLEDKAAEKAEKEVESLVELEPPSVFIKTPTGETCKNPVLVEENRILQSVLPQMLSVEEAKSYVVDLNLDLSNLGRAMGSAMKFFKERNLLVEPNVVKQILCNLISK